MRRGAEAVLLVVVLAAGACGGATPEPETPTRPLTTAEIVRRAMPGVVRLEFPAASGLGGVLGTGFIADREGRIVTNWHVVADATTGIVHLNDGRQLRNIQVLAVDQEHDLAILLVQAERLEPLPLGDGLPSPGDKIVAIGHPRGLTNTVSDGIVSAIRADGVRDRTIQMTTPISHGNSGGPVLNDRGQVVGVAQSTRIDGQNLNFAVPIAYVRALLVADQPRPLARAVRAPRSRLIGGCPRADRDLLRETLWKLISRLDGAARSLDALARFHAFEEAALDLSVRLEDCAPVRRLVLSALARADAGDDGPKERVMNAAFRTLIEEVRNAR